MPAAPAVRSRGSYLDRAGAPLITLTGFPSEPPSTGAVAPAIDGGIRGGAGGPVSAPLLAWVLRSRRRLQDTLRSPVSGGSRPLYYDNTTSLTKKKELEIAHLTANISANCDECCRRPAVKWSVLDQPWFSAPFARGVSLHGDRHRPDE
jgi:hypothetical protein